MGRINYISSHARQENLYAVYETTDKKFWRNWRSATKRNLSKVERMESVLKLEN